MRTVARNGSSPFAPVMNPSMPLPSKLYNPARSVPIAYPLPKNEDLEAIWRKKIFQLNGNLLVDASMAAHLLGLVPQR